MKPSQRPLDSYSPQESLDYACFLVAAGSLVWINHHPEATVSMYPLLAGYIEFRYHDELDLALGNLVALGHACPPKYYNSEEFWRWIRHIAKTIHYNDPDIPQT